MAEKKFEEMSVEEQVIHLNKQNERILEGLASVPQMLANSLSAVTKTISDEIAPMKPFCEQFPSMCKSVKALESKISAAPATETPEAIAEEVMIHYNECTDPECKRRMEARFAAGGLMPIDAAGPEGETKSTEQLPPPPPPAAPWEILDISEAKYLRNKAYYDGVLENGG